MVGEQVGRHGQAAVTAPTPRSGVDDGVFRLHAGGFANRFDKVVSVGSVGKGEADDRRLDLDDQERARAFGGTLVWF